MPHFYTSCGSITIVHDYSELDDLFHCFVINKNGSYRYTEYADNVLNDVRVKWQELDDNDKNNVFMAKWRLVYENTTKFCK